jgi:hypothetical protein
MNETQPLWTLEQGIELARRLELIAIKHNVHVALGGGVLHRGQSNKDVDIFVYRRKTSYPFPGVAVILRAFGTSHWRPRPHEYGGDSKEVWEAKLDGKRVDFFFLQ